MSDASYAVVAYIPGPLGRLVDDLRSRLNPSRACWLAHVTILPARNLRANPEEAVALLRQTCAGLEPFEVTVEGLSTFWPITGVVYLSFSSGSKRLVALHDALNCGGLQQVEVYPYVPHVTIAQGLTDEGTHEALAEGSREWARFQGEPSFRLESLTLVQQVAENRWADLAPIPLGVLLTPSRQ